MGPLTDDQFTLLMKHAGFSLGAEDAARVKALWARYQARLGELRAFDVGDEEAVGGFPPTWPWGGEARP